MGRPEPVVLFAQTILHSQLDEYVDEVLFSEPVVITACEFLEQSASPSTPNITLVGATSPPSFALEVFVHCDGESRFRRLCQPFLYSHSSSNVLEVEAIVTNHLVLRGTYRSLSLVIYGNIAEDLAGNKLFEIWENVNAVADRNIFNDVCLGIEVDEELPTTKMLVELFNNCFPYYQDVSLLDLQWPYESEVVKVVSDLSANEVSTDGVAFLHSASVELSEMLKLMKFCGPIEDPSILAYARKICKSGHLEGLLSYQSTIGLITSSEYGFLQFDTDPYLLSLLQGSAANRILSVSLNSDELLWILWELCAISRRPHHPTSSAFPILQAMGQSRMTPEPEPELSSRKRTENRNETG
ncbi:hypothetical protein PR202_ga31020 [Eleusine coracana subsp. coracana]|uniref:Virilizer N-terminal domain-containing protein n=1 Tax=Eleusine coracana subsp. coracana TaxID=191504 RepID=A0AAV5DS22_ELECO|nr:hypothetical protein PR202_ga31020 [Eleusine coracana subsp. coracana]